LWYAEQLDNTGNWNYETFDDAFVALGNPGDGVINGPTTGSANALAYESFWNGRGAPIDVDGVITLDELWQVRNYGSGDYITTFCMLDGGNILPPIATNHYVGFKFGFQLMSDTTNIYQGDTASFVVNFIAAQLSTYPDNSLNESVTEDLAP
jgi:hypothetical protein